jgi:hypothetical protein
MLLFALIGTVVGLSHVGREGESQLRRIVVSRRWRHILPRLRRS